jgi:hypothetical protein
VAQRDNAHTVWRPFTHKHNKKTQSSQSKGWMQRELTRPLSAAGTCPPCSSRSSPTNCCTSPASATPCNHATSRRADLRSAGSSRGPRFLSRGEVKKRFLVWFPHQVQGMSGEECARVPKVLPVLLCRKNKISQLLSKIFSHAKKSLCQFYTRGFKHF